MSDRAAAAGLIVRTVATIRNVDTAAWDRLAGANPLLAHGWLSVTEQEARAPQERCYVLLERAGRLIGAAACYVDAGRGDAESVDDLVFGRLAGSPAARFLTLRPALVCGYPWSISSGCLFVPDREVPAELLVDTLVAAITATARRQRQTAVFLSVAASEHHLMACLRAQGYRAARHEPLYALDVNWPDFAAYRRSLPSKNIRKNILRELNRNRKEGVTLRVLNEPAEWGARMHAIVEGHFRRYGWREFPYGPGWFGALKTTLGDDAIVAAAFQHGQPVGVAISLRKQGTRQMVLVSVDHAGEGGNLTHFNLAYYWAVTDCIRAGDRRYVVGPGQHLSRRRRGYRPQASYLFCRPHGAVRRRLVGAWLAVLGAWLRRKEPPETD